MRSRGFLRKRTLGNRRGRNGESESCPPCKFDRVDLTLGNGNMRLPFPLARLVPVLPVPGKPKRPGTSQPQEL